MREGGGSRVWFQVSILTALIDLVALVWSTDEECVSTQGRTGLIAAAAAAKHVKMVE